MKTIEEIHADLDCWDAQGTAVRGADNTPITVWVRKPTIAATPTIECLVVDVDKLDDLRLDEARFNDANHQIKDGDMLLLLSFIGDEINDGDCLHTVPVELPTGLLTLSTGKPFYIATRLNGRGKRYKRRTEAIVTPDDPFVILNVFKPA